jgi:threonine dehydratase
LINPVIPSAKEVEHARELLSRYFRPTRLVSADSLAQRSGARIHLKIESDLPTGSFKPRGALNGLLTTAAQRPVSGVVAASTGNHGAAVAYASRIANLAATIFLPENPNPVKRAHIVALGAKVVERGAMGESAASEGAAEFAREHGYYFLDDASDPLVPAGTATIAVKSWTKSQRLTSFLSQWVIPRSSAVLPLKRSVVIRAFALLVFRPNGHPHTSDRGNRDRSSLQIHATRLLMVWRHSIRSKQM